MIRLPLLGLAFAGAIAIASPPAHAQGGNTGNGGDFSELGLKKRVLKLPYYLKQPSVKVTFPDVDLDKLHAKANITNVSIVEEILYDKKGRPRSMKNLVIGGVPTILVNHQALDKVVKDENNVGEVYVLLFHELLNLIDLELTDDVPFKDEFDPAFLSSIYPISSRILLIANEIEKFEPLELDFSKYKFSCDDENSETNMTRYLLTFDSKGHVVFRSHLYPMYKWEVAFPHTYKKYNKRIDDSYKDPKRIIFEGDIPNFKLDSTTQIDFWGKTTNRSKYFSKAKYLKISGQLILTNRVKREIEGQITISPSDEVQWPHQKNTIIFGCQGSPTL